MASQAQIKRETIRNAFRAAVAAQIATWHHVRVIEDQLGEERTMRTDIDEIIKTAASVHTGAGRTSHLPDRYISAVLGKI